MCSTRAKEEELFHRVREVTQAIRARGERDLSLVLLPFVVQGVSLIVLIRALALSGVDPVRAAHGLSKIPGVRNAWYNKFNGRRVLIIEPAEEAQDPRTESVTGFETYEWPSR